MPEGEETPPSGVRAAAVVRWAIVAAVGLAAAITVGSSLVSVGTEERATQQWYCPMHPQIHQDHPGECPICGMDLVPRDDEGATGPTGPTGKNTRAHEPSQVAGLAPVMISAERIQSSGIRTVRAIRKVLAPAVRAVGVVSTNEREQADVTARVPGWYRAQRAAAVGDRVRRREALGSIESPEVLALSRELLAVRGLAARGIGLGADELASPVRQRLELLGLPRAAVDEIQESGRPIERVPVAAPISGIVTAREVDPGAYVERGALLYHIADLSRVWVVAQVYPRDLQRIAVGQRAEVRLEGGSAPAARGEVTYVYPVTDEDTRTTRVRVELPNPDLRLRPGLFAEVTIQGAPVDGVVVPAEAVNDTGDRQYVFVSKADGQFEPRLVRVGLRVGEEVVLLDGVSAGEEVVSSGTFLLDSESRLRSTIDGRMPGMPEMQGPVMDGGPQ